MENVRSCSCKNEFQDEKYGKGMRLKNKTTSGYRCTVCGASDSGNGTVKKK